MAVTTFPPEDVLIRSLARSWWPVARVEEVESRPQDGHPATLLDRPLVVFRGESGRIYVADRQCPHRGASLAIGRVCAESIACPYHGWQWDGESGKCTRIPALGEDQTRIPPAAKLRTYPTVTRWGLVWTCLDETSDESVVDPPEFQGEWSIATRISEQDTNLLFSIENFRDVAHFPFVHEATFGAPPDTRYDKLDVEERGYEVFMRTRGGEFPANPSTTGFYSTGYDSIRVVYHAYAPGVVLAEAKTEQGGWILMHCPSPVSLETTRAFRVLALSNELKHRMDEFCDTEDVVYEEDAVVASTIEPRRLGATIDQTHTLADAYTLAFRRKFCAWVDAQADAVASSGAETSSWS